jgi:hypothetical protein
MDIRKAGTSGRLGHQEGWDIRKAGAEPKHFLSVMAGWYQFPPIHRPAVNETGPLAQPEGGVSA